MVDTMAYDVATNKYIIGGGIQGATSGGWNTAANVINELVDAKTGLADYGYQADTAVISPRVGAMLIKQKMYVMLYVLIIQMLLYYAVISVTLWGFHLSKTKTSKMETR